MVTQQCIQVTVFWHMFLLLNSESCDHFESFALCSTNSMCLKYTLFLWQGFSKLRASMTGFMKY